jgi:hypothetical protein
MTVRFSVSLKLHGLPTVRHIRDIEESIRLAMAKLCHQNNDTLAIQSCSVNGESTTVRFSADLELRNVASLRHAGEIEQSVRLELKPFRCLAADELSVVSHQICTKPAVALERIA